MGVTIKDDNKSKSGLGAKEYSRVSLKFFCEIRK